jgi:DNA-binding NarL/FixJ family response regulator
MPAHLIAIVGASCSLFGAGLGSLLSERMRFSKIVPARTHQEIAKRLQHSPATRLLTVDLEMPGMRDVDRLRKLRMQFPSLYVVVVSDSPCREDMLLALAGGAHGYVPTSMPFDEIASAFSTILSGQIYVPAEIANLEPKRPRVKADNDCALSTDVSKRQREVMALIARGNSNKQIARILSLSEGTIKTHISAAYRKLGVNNRASATAALGQAGIAS